MLDPIDRRRIRRPRRKMLIAAGSILLVLLCLFIFLAFTGRIPWFKDTGAGTKIDAIVFEIEDGGFLAACYTDEG